MWVEAVGSVYLVGMAAVGVAAGGLCIVDMVKHPKARAGLSWQWGKVALGWMLLWPWLIVVLFLTVGLITWTIASRLATLTLAYWAKIGANT